MTERYEKRGSAIRLEMSRGDAVIVTVNEQGVAENDGGSFASRSLAPPEDPEQSVSLEIESLARTLAQSPRIERASVSSGISTHRVVDERGERQWKTRDALAHISLRTPFGPPIEATIDGAHFLDWFHEIDVLLSRARRLRAATRAAALHFVLDPLAAAQLWAHVARSPHVESSLQQCARTIHERDGAGDEIDEGPGSAGRRRNVFRPSYRYRPLRVPLNLKRLPFGTAVESDVRIVSFESLSGDSSIRGHAFVVDRGLLSFAEVHLDPAAIDFVGDTQLWFPIDAGVWGGRCGIRGRMLPLS